MTAFFAGSVAIVIHMRLLGIELMPGGSGLTLPSAISLIGLQLGIIALLSSLDPRLRGVAAGMLFLAALTSGATAFTTTPGPSGSMSWQMRTHVLTSMFAYGLLTVGAIVAVYALVQEKRLRSGQLSAANQLFAPLETTEKLLFTLTGVGFAVLAFSVISGFTFVEDLFAQHLVHKTALSLLALGLFGLLLAGRHFAGWRGSQAVYLYLAAFAILGLGYFGSRFVLEELLGRSWS